MYNEAEIKEFVDAHWDEIQQDFAHLIAIPSVLDEESASDEAPFGKPARQCLDEVLAIAERLGLEAQPCDNYCAVADLPGKDDQQIAVVAHVDVVPAGPGWNTDPFELVVRDGWMLGRGVQDDKGPGLLGLWAAAYFVEKGITPAHTIRVIFGSNEETGMVAIKKYVKENPEPDFMFTPDAEFPVISGEKGIVHGEISLQLAEDSTIVDMSAGVAGNVIPAHAEATVRASYAQLPQAEFISLEDKGEGLVRIQASGISGHASMPEGTRNAIKVLFDYLVNNDLISASDAPVASFIQTLVADSYGRSLGIACEDDFLGELTCVGGVLTLEGKKLTASIDVRYPTAITLEGITEAVESQLAACGGSFEPGHVEHSHVVDPSSAPVAALMKSYVDFTGSHADPIAIGGGTYAKRFKNSVAFGPVELERDMPSWAGVIHGPNEAMSIEEAKSALAIYIGSLLNLMEIDLRA